MYIILFFLLLFSCSCPPLLVFLESELPSWSWSWGFWRWGRGQWSWPVRSGCRGAGRWRWGWEWGVRAPGGEASGARSGVGGVVGGEFPLHCVPETSRCLLMNGLREQGQCCSCHLPHQFLAAGPVHQRGIARWGAALAGGILHHLRHCIGGDLGLRWY